MYSVSIVPTGGAGGYDAASGKRRDVQYERADASGDDRFSRRTCGAEEEIFDDITTGASQDIKQATAIAKSMITKFGMSERLGLINYDNDSDEVFIGRDFGYPEDTERKWRERSTKR